MSSVRDYVYASHCPDACAVFDAKLTTQLPTNVWTDVQLVWPKTGTIGVSFIGGPVGVGQHTTTRRVREAPKD